MIQIDNVVKNAKRDDWRGHLPKENEIKEKIYNILKNEEKVEAIFKVIREQKEY